MDFLGGEGSRNRRLDFSLVARKMYGIERLAVPMSGLAVHDRGGGGAPFSMETNR